MSEDAPQQKCPNCGEDVAVGVIECPICGTNVKSGETFEMKVKRAQEVGEHSEKYAGRIFLLVALGFGLLILAGFFTQRGAEEFIRDHPKMMRGYAEDMARLDRHIEQQEYDRARKLGEDLIERLEKEAEELVEGPAHEHQPTSKGKRFLVSLRKRVQHKLESIE